LIGQAIFVAALAAGLASNGLLGGAWAVSIGMLVYFGWFFIKLPGKCPQASVSAAK
jgi:hypothetical protein